MPPVMKFLSGPYEQSLEANLGVSLWLALGELLARYRTVVDRFAHLKGASKRGLVLADVSTVDNELRWLRSQSLPAFAGTPVTKLASNVLHKAWHPVGSAELPFPLYLRPSGCVDLAEDDLRDQLRALTESTLERVTDFLLTQAL